MTILAEALIGCIPTVSAVMVLSVMFYTFFAILGVGLFSGRLYECEGGSAAFPFKLSHEACDDTGGTWKNRCKY